MTSAPKILGIREVQPNSAIAELTLQNWMELREFLQQHDPEAVEVVVLDLPAGDVIGRGSCYGGPDYEFVVVVTVGAVLPGGR